MRTVLFVGSFKKQANDGSVGGQMFACRSLLETSNFEKMTVHLLDSTARSVPAPPVFIRIPYVILRLLKFLYYLIVKGPSIILVFTSAGLSFVEKGLMVIIANFFNRRTVLAPRSGLIKSNVSNSRFYKWLVSTVVNKSDIIICQSQSWKEFYMSVSNSIEEDKFRVIKNWIDPGKYLENNSDHDTGTKPESLKIIYLGWLERYKGIVDLIEAVKILECKSIHINLDIYGDGSLSGYLKDEIKKSNFNGNIKLRGWANEQQKMNALKECDIFILPSHLEGFPNALLEAMASEKAAIATSVGAIPELVMNEVNGLLIPSKSPEKIATAIQSLITNSDLRKAIAKNARQTVLEEHSVDKAGVKFDSIFSELLTNK